MRKLGLFIVLACTLAQPYCKGSNDCGLGSKLYAKCVESGTSSGECIIKLSDVVSGKWDRVLMLYGPDTPWNIQQTRDLDISEALQDGERRIVFAHDREVICSQTFAQYPTHGPQIDLHASPSREERADAGYSRAEAVFRVFWERYGDNCLDCYYFDLSLHE